MTAFEAACRVKRVLSDIISCGVQRLQRIHVMSHQRVSIPRFLFLIVLTTVALLFIFLQTSFLGRAFFVRRPGIGDDGGVASLRNELADIFVVMRTGASVIEQSLPVQLNTTLSHVPDYVIFSDLEQEFHGHHVLDALADVKDEIKRSNNDFQYYNRLQENGLASFTEEEKAEWPAHESGNSGNMANPGWRLDKWKFLPMVTKALEMRPDAKWFYFIEADTYAVWPNLVRWLATFDASKRNYIGNRFRVGDTKFAYGGTGIAISAPAMRKAAELRAEHLETYDELTANQWAGDAILGMLMEDAGIKLKSDRAVFGLKGPSGLDYAIEEERGLLCGFNPVSFHHMSPAEISETWETEQDLLHEVRENSRHKLGLSNIVCSEY